MTRPTPKEIDYALCEFCDALFDAGIQHIAFYDMGLRTHMAIDSDNIKLARRMAEDMGSPVSVKQSQQPEIAIIKPVF